MNNIYLFSENETKSRANSRGTDATTNESQLVLLLTSDAIFAIAAGFLSVFNLIDASIFTKGGHFIHFYGFGSRVIFTFDRCVFMSDA